MMVANELYDKRRGQRMLLTKWIRTYNSTDDEDEREVAARKLADVLAWAKSVGMPPSAIAEDRDLTHRALELLEAGAGTGHPAGDSELRAAEKEVASSVDTANVTRLGDGSGSVYAYGYKCAPDRLKIGRTNGDVVNRIVSQINARHPTARYSTLSSRPTTPVLWNAHCTARWSCVTDRWRAVALNGLRQPSTRSWQFTMLSWASRQSNPRQ